MVKFRFLTLSLAISGISNAQMLSPATIGSMGLVLPHNDGKLSFTANNLLINASQPPADSIVIQSLEAFGNKENDSKTGFFAVYPNPAVDNLWFTFQLPGQGTVVITLYNSLGQQIKEIYNGNYDDKKTSNQLDLSKLSPANYLLNLKFTNSKNGTTQILNRRFEIIY